MTRSEVLSLRMNNHLIILYPADCTTCKCFYLINQLLGVYNTDLPWVIISVQDILTYMSVCWKSLMYIQNRMGPIMLHCGTPWSLTNLWKLILAKTPLVYQNSTQWNIWNFNYFSDISGNFTGFGRISRHLTRSSGN